MAATVIEDDVRAVPGAAVRSFLGLASGMRRDVEREVLADARLSWTGFCVLDALAEHAHMEVRRLSQHVGITTSTVVGVIDHLEERGLVRRERHRNDRRRVSVHLTDAGRLLHERLEARFALSEQRVVRQAASELDPASAGLLAAALMAAASRD